MLGNVIIEPSSTPWWFAVIVAVVGVVGVAVGGLIQRWTQRDDWLRSARLNAYADLVQTAHDYSNDVVKTADAGGVESASDPFFRKLEDLCQRASVVAMIGPGSAGRASETLQDEAEKVARFLTNRARVAVWIDTPGPAKNQLLDPFVQALNRFLDVGRECLDVRSDGYQVHRQMP